MPIPGNEEPSGQQQSMNFYSSIPLKKRRSLIMHQVQQQQFIDFSNAVPVKKRGFLVIGPASSSHEEEPCSSEDNDDSKEKQEINIADDELPYRAARGMDSPGNSVVSKNSVSIIEKENVTLTNIKSAHAIVDIFAPNPQEAKPGVSLGPIDDLLSNEKSADAEVPGSRLGCHLKNVNQEIVSELESSADAINVEFSLGPKEPRVRALDQQKSGIRHMSDKSDSSFLSLALSEEKLVLHDKKDSTINNVSDGFCAKRSNLDLNTTMDVNEVSTNKDAFGHNFIDIGWFSKTNNTHDVKSSLTTAGSVGPCLNKETRILDDYRSDSANTSLQLSQQCKTDDCFGLRLVMPCMDFDSRGKHSATSDKLVSKIVGANLDLQRVQLSDMNVSIASCRIVKSEPVDENSNCDYTIGGSSSSSMGSLKFSPTRRELVENYSLETVLLSSISSEKLVDHISLKPELVQDDSQEVCKSVDATLAQSVGRLMQHQDRCASSSAQPLPLMPQNSCTLSASSELTISEDLSNQSEHSFHSKEVHGQNDDIIKGSTDTMVSTTVSQDDKQLRACKVWNSDIDEHTLELCGYGEVTADDDEKISISGEIIEDDIFRSDSESHENHAFDTSMDDGENIWDKQNEKCEIVEPLQHSARENLFEGKKTENLELECHSRNMQPSVHSDDQNVNVSDFNREDALMENHEPIGKDNSLHNLSDEVLEVGVDEKRSVSLTPEKQLDLSRTKDVREGPGKEVISGPTNGSNGIGIELGYESINMVFKETCLGKNNSTSTMVESSVHGNDAAIDSNNIGNKRRIINLRHASVVKQPCETKSIPDRLMASQSGKAKYSDFHGEKQPQGDRDKVHTGGSNRFAKDKVHDQSFRNSRLSFTHGRGRVSGRFGSIHNEHGSAHDFAYETYNCPSDYQVVRHKHASSVPDVELECNGYDIASDGTATGRSTRKAMNDEFPPLRRSSFRRLSPGDRDGPVTRGVQMLRRIPRNISPGRCNVEYRHGDKFMRHLSYDIIDPIYTHPQATYDELDGRLVRGNKNFSTMQGGGYPRIRSKSPIRSWTWSPGPWSSSPRRFPDRLPVLNQHRSRALYSMGRMRSPENACFCDEMVARRRGSPSLVARYPKGSRDVDSGWEHIHPKSANFNKRSSPARIFPRSDRRADASNSREMGDGDEYTGGTFQSNRFHELHGDGSVDKRRKFIERQRPLRSFRPSYNGDGDNFRFHLNDGPRPYRFCPDADAKFIERSKVREMEIDRGIIRIGSIKKEQDGNYRPGERVWHDDGSTDVSRVKRRF
ncbi:hypothetical protein BUALT_Bualt06G0056400 [Buddleja alternifolia]|uniref:Uncharacterized protein n=1 Tax=Buddleja alternifolia TaxID=168488 RepID=A0AAV6XLC9_9LAMI|nr:hypothetical protein BUALT_Bualt06G0056400 [Buddleja alternifolia]